MKRRGLLVVAAMLAGGALYLATAARMYGLGFPLDDAWIHQTYARNFARDGAWVFVPGRPSAGSTAPLWTVLLVPAYWIGANPLLWTYGLGILTLAALAWVGSRWFADRFPERQAWAVWVALGLALEWHLLWAALSGMETLGLALVAAVVLLGLERGWAPWLLGGIIGLGVWLRPDALSLLLPLGWCMVWQKRDPRRLAAAALQALLALGLLFVPYVFFNWHLSGALWPTTFYAKQVEYAVLRARPLWLRLAEQGLQPLVGVGAVLLPGMLIALGGDVRRPARLAPWLWVIAYLGAYALRLPVTYQHGRYAMPTVPVLLALGAEGAARWMKGRGNARWSWVLSRAWAGTAGAVLLSFLGLGARAYAADVAIIETEMVAAARWVAQETPLQARVAAHDIGALGYFGRRDLIDLAGLVSPEVIPILHDEAALARFLDEQRVDYLVSFPGWYPRLTARAEPVFVTGGRFSPQAGGENMVVYRWRRDHLP